MNRYYRSSINDESVNRSLSRHRHYNVVNENKKNESSYSGIINKKAAIYDMLKEFANTNNVHDYDDIIMEQKAAFVDLMSDVFESVQTLQESKKVRHNTSINEAASNNNGLRNSALYGFVKNTVAKTIASTLNNYNEKCNATVEDKVDQTLRDVTIKVKKNTVGENISKIFANSYNGMDPETGIGMVPISNHKFVNAKENCGFAFISPDDDCVYVIPSIVLQQNWGDVMISRNSVRGVIDAIGMRSMISICDVEKLRMLAAKEGIIIPMDPNDAAKYKAALAKFLQ